MRVKLALDLGLPPPRNHGGAFRIQRAKAFFRNPWRMTGGRSSSAGESVAEVEQNARRNFECPGIYLFGRDLGCKDKRRAIEFGFGNLR